MSKCRHEEMVPVVTLEDGRVEWVCRCGKWVIARGDLEREEVRGFVLATEFLRESLRPL
jgi:hypothetical protein